MVFLVLGSCFLTAETQPFVRLQGQLNPPGLSQGGKGNWTILAEIAPDIHLSDAASGFFSVHPRPDDYVTFGGPIYPKGIEKPYGSIYRGKVSVTIPISLHVSAPIGERTLTAEVRIQPCGEKNGICYSPETMRVSSKLVILAGIGQSLDLQAETGTDESMAGRLRLALERGSILAFFLVFLGGLLTSLTPCVYPMIPITLAVIGAQASGSRMKGFVLSLFYVLGIAVTFSGLGVAAAKSGSLFGTVAQHSVVQVVLALVFFLMGLSLLGVFVLQIPASLAGKIRGKKRTGYLGALLTGLLAGLVVSPCIGPVLVVILAWVAKTGNAFLGFSLLFSFALGLGVLFILIGTFSGVLKNLPKAGVWTEHIETVFGVLLVG
ncbi:MAG TPA: cytochrome c biogenesis protein CcdA, partial [bacterium]